MKKSRILCLIIAICLTICFSVPVSAEEADVSVEYGCNTFDAKVPFLGSAEKMDSAASAILFEANSETLMYAWNPDTPLYPASLVKIMTAMIAIQEGTMTDVVTVTKEVLDTVPANAMVVKLYSDEVITVQDLLYCMMVASANDAAAVLAHHIAGSQAQFVAKMNQYAKELGCTATEFTDVHGVDGKQRTTARDLARILSHALKNEEFRKLFGTVYYKTAATNKTSERALASGNYLLNDDESTIYYDKRVTGSRTGIDANGDRCIASTAAVNGMQMICIVLGAKDVYSENGYSIKLIGGYKETSHLLDIGLEGYQAVQLLYQDQALQQTQVENGDCLLTLGPNINASSVLPQGVTPDQLTYKYGATGSVSLPVDKGDRVSDVQIWYGNVCLVQSGLYALNKVQNRLYDSGNLNSGKQDPQWLLTAMKILAVVVLLAVAVLFGLRAYAKLRYTAARSRSRRHRRNRRRSR